MVPPKAFVSHTGADKELWARPLAEKLREHGIESWFDEWEIRGGDSIVQKVFEAGIGSTDAFVIILSAKSLASPWVQAELATAAVQAIEGKLRPIPVRVDESAVPLVIKDKLYLSIDKYGTVGALAKEIADILHGVNKAPPVGSVPAYVTRAGISLPNVSKLDSLVLEKMYEISLNEDGQFSDFPALNESLNEVMDWDQVTESLDMLVSHGYLIGDERSMQNDIYLATINPVAVQMVAGAKGVEINTIRCQLVTALLNAQGDQLELDSFAELSGTARLHVWSIATELENTGAVQVIRSLGPEIGSAIVWKRAVLKRWAEVNCG